MFHQIINLLRPFKNQHLFYYIELQEQLVNFNSQFMKFSKRINKIHKKVTTITIFLCSIVATPFFTLWYERWDNEGNLILIERKPFVSGRNYTSFFALINTSNRPCADVKIVFRTLQAIQNSYLEYPKVLSENFQERYSRP
jgi:hypothetical protein